jgi:hypothetical protein
VVPEGGKKIVGDTRRGLVVVEKVDSTKEGR